VAWDGVPVAGTAVADLNPDRVSALLAVARRGSPRALKNIDDAQALFHLGALARSGNGEILPTIAGLLAIGNFPQQFLPRLAISVAVHHRALFTDRMTITGAMPDMVPWPWNRLGSRTWFPSPGTSASPPCCRQSATSRPASPWPPAGDLASP
jgi:predicted HTH transcriptional regulator